MMLLKRDLFQPTVWWAEGKGGSDLSQNDCIRLLGRGAPAHGYSLVKGVRNIPPYHSLDYTQNVRTVKRQWFCGGTASTRGMERNLGAIREALENTFKTRMPEECVAISLSGGLDSSILSCLAKRLGYNVRGYVVEPASRGGPKEAVYAKKLAHEIGIPCDVVGVSNSDLEAAREIVARVRAAPVICWVVASQLALCRRAHDDGHRMIISGLGSDEAFGGYHLTSAYAHRVKHQRETKHISWESLIQSPKCWEKYMFIGQCRPFQTAALRKLFPEADVEEALGRDVHELYRQFQTEHRAASYEACQLQLELELRTGDILLAELDAVAAHCEVTTFYPFLDRRVLEIAAGLGIDRKYAPRPVAQLRDHPPTKHVDKAALRLVFQDILPTWVQTRPRRTFTVPFAVWRRGKEVDRMRGEVIDSNVWKCLPVDRKVLRGILAADLRGDPWKRPFQLWVLHEFVRWWDGGGPRRLHRNAVKIEAATHAEKK